MTYLIVFFVFALVIAMMAVGVMVHGRAIRGSCGGLNNQGACTLCSDGGCRKRANE